MANLTPLVLCVDDELTPLTIRKLVLQRAGFRVLTVTSAKAALELLQTTEVDLVISDQLMPEMTGVELVARVKHARPTLPIMLLSGVNEIPEGAELADDFMSKLEGPETMIERARTLLKS